MAFCNRMDFDHAIRRLLAELLSQCNNGNRQTGQVRELAEAELKEHRESLRGLKVVYVLQDDN